MKKGIYLFMFIAVLGGCKQQLNFVKVANNIYMNQIQAFGDAMLLKVLQA